MYAENYRTLMSSVQFSCSAVSDSMRPHGLKPARLLCPWNFRGKNTGVGCHFLLQGIFLTQGLNSHLLLSPTLQADSLPLPHQGSPSNVYAVVLNSSTSEWQDPYKMRSYMWLNLEIIIQTEVHQKEKNKHCKILLTCGIWKNDRWTYLQSRIETQM